METGGSVLPYLVLHRRGFAMPSPLAGDAVRSYRTISPLPRSRTSAVYFLLHFPSRHHAWMLSSLLPVGVRTFLRPGDPDRRFSNPLRPRENDGSGKRIPRADRS